MTFTGALDDHTSNLAVAWSLTRRLLTSYTGALFRVRADRTGQPEQDIGYLANGDVDTAALQTFVGSDDAYLVTAYRQDGSSDHPTQATAANQPRIALAGVLEEGGFFNGTVADHHLDIPSVDVAAYTDGTHIQIVVEANSSSGANGRMFDSVSGELGFWSEYSGSLYWDAPQTGGGRISGATPGSYLDAFHVVSLERDGATSNIRVDGSVAITAGVGSTVSGTSIFRIGNLAVGGGAWAGHLKSFVIWKDCTSPATRAAALA